MDCQIIEKIISELKVNERGNIRGKRKAIDAIHSEHLKKLDSELTDVRLYVTMLSTSKSTEEVLTMIDDFIYKKQVN